MHSSSDKAVIAIACGGTGGHLFPGLAVAESLLQRGCNVSLLVSPKEVDQQAVKMAAGMEIVTLPAIGLTRGSELAFVRGFVASYQTARTFFKTKRPHAALAMGGFTSAPPILAAKRSGAQTFLHESNAIPGRANRWLSWVVTRSFVGFPEAASRLHTRNVAVTGTPVRPQFRARDAAGCRAALGLDPQRPVLLVMGGSQGATGVNNLVLGALPQLRSARAGLAKLAPQLQYCHLAGPNDFRRVKQAYATSGARAVVHSFFAEMDVALGAATAAVSRAGASSLAELAAVRVPAVLVPFPAATDNHQFHNARAFEQTGAARLLEEKAATPETLTQMISELVGQPMTREQMQNALAKWHAPHAAGQIAEDILNAIFKSAGSHTPAKESAGRGQGGPGSNGIEQQNFSTA
jgi:UDP-N-acetylglucosamine--N-acetylmuramyl-(pentapeptide) pyrophosphoryl-undecaprenol N-acetylglucosamine transferase